MLIWRLGKLEMPSEAAQLSWLRRECGLEVASVREILHDDFERTVVPKLVEAEAVPWRT